VGVTGHRQLDDENALRARVRFALLMLTQREGGSTRHPDAITVYSAIAEGADRLVADEVLKLPNSSLQVVLPFARADYENDFESPASKGEFASLLQRATNVRELPAGDTREEGYENAGWAIVDACDVLIAIWDGKESRGRGGTAEIVEYARKRGKEVVWIGAHTPHLVKDENGPADSPDTTDFNAYLSHKLSEGAIREHTETQRGYWAPADPATTSELPLDELMDWILPDFVRADMLAQRYQRAHTWVGALLFSLPVVAVVVVTIQAFFYSNYPKYALIEVATLLLLLAFVLVSHRNRVHNRWISYRFLAERLRSSYFLAVIASSDQRRDRTEVAYLEDPSDEWIRLLIAEVNGRRPQVELTPTYVIQARDYLATNWIHDQEKYHRDASARHGRGERRFRNAIVILFVIALFVAIFHAIRHGEDIGKEKKIAWVLIQLSIVVPVVGAALHGISSQHEFKRHAQRYERMAKLLDGLHTRMCATTDKAEVQQVASDVERLIRDENSDWFGVMRFHDVELIT
jgi:hypothetical protein